ncbi:MAG: protein kinase [Planctomycetia bacterium]|nr:protein kinase [Planctomycetia bacterium]
MTATACPSVRELLAFQVGDLDEFALVQVADHLEACARCQATAQELDGTTDGVLSGLKGLAGATRAPALPPARDERYQSLLTRLAQLPVAAMPAVSESLGFLSPPECPDDLGRLGQYRVRRVLGQGGMGLVFEAEDTDLQRAVALKVLRPHLVPEPESRQRFLREARAMAALRNEHVVTVYQVGQVNDVPFLAMELLDGASLEDWLDRLQRPTVAQLLRLARETAAGLAAAHAVGLVHRDVKPANIWLQRAEADRVWVKILDFGLACAAVQDVRLTGRGYVLGTPAYMSPEQASGAAVDARSDLFSLGCMLYRLATGILPFPGETPMAILTALATHPPQPVGQLAPGLPHSLAALIMRLLEKQPADRPPSALAVIESLRLIENQQADLLTEPVSPLRRTQAETAKPALSPTVAAVLPAPRRRRWPTLVAGIVALVLLVFVAWPWFRGDDHARATPPRDTVPHAPPTVADEAAWLKSTAGLAPKEQLDAVRERLRRLNPGFDGALEPRLNGDQVVGLTLPGDALIDLSPLRALTHLQSLNVSGNRVSPSKLVDLKPLAGLPLQELRCDYTQVADLKVLRDLPLRRLQIEGTPVRDLSPLADQRDLVYLELSGSAVSDLRPIADVPLKVLRLNSTQIGDLQAVQKMPLEHLSCDLTSITNLSPLTGKPLAYLRCQGLHITDFKPLTGMPLLYLWANLDPVRDRAVLASLTSLKTLNGQPVEALGKP